MNALNAKAIILEALNELGVVRAASQTDSLRWSAGDLATDLTDKLIEMSRRQSKPGLNRLHGGSSVLNAGLTEHYERGLDAHGPAIYLGAIRLLEVEFVGCLQR